MPIIGFLLADPLEARREHVDGFRAGLSQAGYVEGRDVRIEYRSAETRNDRLPGLAADLVRLQPTAIVAPSTSAALAAKGATATIPIVFVTGADPVQIGLVASLNRPNGNLTGISTLNSEIAAKRFELLHQLLPATTSIAFLTNQTNPDFAEAEKREIQRAAQAFAMGLLVLNASTGTEIEAAFEILLTQPAGALIVSGDSLFITQRDQLAALAIQRGVPMMCQYREQVAAGALMSYGTSLPDAYRIMGAYTGRILKGESPNNLPVQQATKVELVLNMKTAKALGLTFPTALLVRADEVIE